MLTMYHGGSSLFVAGGDVGKKTGLEIPLPNRQTDYPTKSPDVHPGLFCRALVVGTVKPTIGVDPLQSAPGTESKFLDRLAIRYGKFRLVS